MKKNKFTLSSVLSMIILLGFMGWQYLSDNNTSSKKESKNTSQHSNIQSMPKQVSQDLVGNYDYNMRNDPIGQNKAGETHYYTLALSWSPGFCESQIKRFGNNLPNSLEAQCGQGKHFGWIIHGLWPQNQFAKSVSEHPRFCQGDLPMVDANIMKKYLSESPSPNLLQGEWEKHGACAFEKAEQYFEKQRELYRTLVLPAEDLGSRNALFSWLKKNNPQLKNHHLGASHNELFICYGLDWKVMDCPAR
ncbi:ribonuclease T2 [Bisgaardia hudsonensis]|uniref:Ribonuclease T2 n=1 Tax=Bisgaardia hudsonensis TaxID=109472 RepID=A0A4R2MVD3_9PAST|nr:ribonuclease [Bisgaardia hudsonensis]QLB12200.1 ribonuclease [Bisgaardia hudsonensis]TCP12241.1 ribonuclease T2 [Bisgaardia hudsonensis]